MLFGLITEKEAKVLKNKILKYFVWILIITGVSIIYASSFKEEIGEYLSDILEKIGLSVLSSGVFAAVLKSMQFQGVFREELEKIVLGTKFLDKRTDLNKLWKKVSKSVYSKKFPEISNELNNLILETYLPTKHQYYYEDFRCTIKINELSEEGIMKYVQSYSFIVCLAKGEDKADLENTLTLDKISGHESYVNERTHYKIDGVDKLNEAKKESFETESEKKTKYKYTVHHKKKFHVDISEERTVCIEHDNFKLFRTNKITKGMDVSISYPTNVKVSFFNIGLINRFEKNHIEHDRIISRIHKKGLILPHQGFGMTFSKC